MSGGLAHIIGEDGKFTMDLLENMGDVQEAFDECLAVIVALSEGEMSRVSAACRAADIVDPYRKDRYEDEPMPAVMEGSETYASPWPLTEILKRLVDLGEHALTTMDCDRHGHELDRSAVEAAKEMLGRLENHVEKQKTMILCKHCSRENCYEHCQETEDGNHEADPESGTVPAGCEFLVDYTCKHCGLSGSLAVESSDIMWE